MSVKSIKALLPLTMEETFLSPLTKGKCCHRYLSCSTNNYADVLDAAKQSVFGRWLLKSYSSVPFPPCRPCSLDFVLNKLLCLTLILPVSSVLKIGQQEKRCVPSGQQQSPHVYRDSPETPRTWLGSFDESTI
ncbi:hypothetical protein TNCV_3918021 [Trichonephila clavipes]|nr:hypothetical protein TNCV_3918021 [Trichonephila clavipes]